MDYYEFTGNESSLKCESGKWEVGKGKQQAAREKGRMREEGEGFIVVHMNKYFVQYSTRYFVQYSILLYSYSWNYEYLVLVQYITIPPTPYAPPPPRRHRLIARIIVPPVTKSPN